MLIGLVALTRTKAGARVIRRLGGIARAVAYLAVVSGVLAFFTMRSAFAEFREKSMEFGRDLMPLKDLLGHTTEIRLNGQPVFISTADTPDSIHDVLNRFEENCKANGGATSDMWKDIMTEPALAAAAKEKGGMAEMGIQRSESPDGKEGSLTCFTHSDGQPMKWTDAFAQFQATGDLGRLGNVRYAYAARQKDGSTAVRTMWTQGSFNINRIMPPESGDAMGSDPAGLPRPDNSRRTFTAEAVGQDYSARVYESTDSPEASLDSYDAKMEKEGWERVATNDTGHVGHWYVRANGDQSVFQATEGSNGKTTLVLGALGKIEAAPTAERP